MDQQSDKISSFGFVDTYENGHFTGWAFNNQTERQSVNIHINSHLIAALKADKSRPDVKEAGINTELCGFSFGIDLSVLPANGCDISINEPTYGKALQNGKFRYQDGILTLQDVQDTSAQPVEIKTYVSVVESVRSTLTSAALLQLTMDVLGKTPLSIFVAMSYLIVLGRTPDPDGFKNSLHGNLNSDTSKRQFILSMINSAEFQAKRSIASAVNDLEKFRE